MSEPGLGETPLQIRARKGAVEAQITIIECLAKIACELSANARLEFLPAEHPLSMELRACVTAYVQAIRQLEVSPESTLVLVKGLVRDHLPADSLPRRAIADDVARWAVHAYYPRS